MLSSESLARAIVSLVAVSTVVPVLPVVREFTSALSPRDARDYALRALLAGNAVAVGFLFLSPLLFAALAVNVNDLRIAGGVVLLVYATHDILFSRARRSRGVVDSVDADDLPTAVAPLGVPILVGPATLSTLVVIGESEGSAAACVGLAFAGTLNVMFLLIAPRLLDVAGEGVSRATGKVMSLVLATLGAGMLRAGITAAIAGG